MFSDLNLSDMETCYKAFRRELIQGITIRENRFGFEPEITLKIARAPSVRVYEVGISYSGRTYQEGKKIGWKDGLRAVWCIVKYRPRRLKASQPRVIATVEARPAPTPTATATTLRPGERT